MLDFPKAPSSLPCQDLLGQGLQLVPFETRRVLGLRNYSLPQVARAQTLLIRLSKVCILSEIYRLRFASFVRRTKLFV